MSLRFSAGIIVLNGMPWIPYLLRSLYPVMDEILIVEGATISAEALASAQGRSLDGTVEAIRAFPDPDGKIQLIQKHGFYPEKDDMSQAYAAEASGDYLWQVDCDEFYKVGDIKWLKSYLAQHRDIGAVSFKTLNFFGGLRGVVCGARYAYGYDQFWRLFRWGKGYQYATHREPTVLDAAGNDTRTHGTLHGNHLAQQHGIYMYHYSYVLTKQVREKAIYHDRLGRYHGMIDHQEWLRKHWAHFTPWRVHMDAKRPVSYLVPFNGEHPLIIQQMMKDTQSGKLEVDLSTRPEIQRLLQSPWRWRLWASVGLIDARLWWVFDRWLRPLLRPIVRPIRARFFGYDYSRENQHG